MASSKIRKDCYVGTFTLSDDITINAGSVATVKAQINSIIPMNTPLAVMPEIYTVNHIENVIFYASRWYSNFNIMAFNSGSSAITLPKDSPLYVLYI